MAVDDKRILIALTTLAIAFLIPYLLGRIAKRAFDDEYFYRERITTVMLAVIPALLYVVAGVNIAICGLLPCEFHNPLEYCAVLIRWGTMAIDHLVNLPVHILITAMILPVLALVIGGIWIGIKFPDDEFFENFRFVVYAIAIPTILVSWILTWIVNLIVTADPNDLVLGGGLLTAFIITACVGGGGTIIVIILKD